MEQDRKMAETERKAKEAEARREDEIAKREAKKEEAQRRREEHADRMKSRELDREIKKKDSKRKSQAAKEKRENERVETARKSEKEREKKKNDKEKDKKRELKRQQQNTKKEIARVRSIKVGFDQVSDDDGTATAMSKFGTNVGKSVGAVGKAAFFGARAALSRRKENQLKKKMGGDEVTTSTPTPSTQKALPSARSQTAKAKTSKGQTVKTQKLLPGRKDSERKALPAAKSEPERKALPAARSPERKALPAAKSAPERKALPAAKSAPERKALPAAKEKGTYVGKKYTITQGRSKGGPLAKKPDGGAGSLTRAVDKANNLRAAKRAQTTSSDDYASNAERKAAFKKKREEQRAAGIPMRSNATEEFIYEVEKMKKEKVDKVIDIMRGRNKIEVNPKLGESYLLVQDLADYKPLEIETVDVIKADPIKPTQSNWRAEIEEASAAWTRKAGKNKSGGLNEKGRKSYERENPGSDLKAPSKKVGNPRRKSFCARMRGMKKKLTSSKTANDPNSRINKSLRAWNC